MRHTDRRRFGRRTKSIRFRFEAEGQERRAVTTSVGPGGAFLKASYVPPVGTTVVLRELYGQGSPKILLRGEVRWAIDTPTLDRPDTGFGVALRELFTREDPSTLEDFLRYLDPSITAPDIEFEERADGVYAVYHFPTDSDVPTALQAEAAPALVEEELPSVDLERELARLERQQARAEATARTAKNTTTTGTPRAAGQRPRSRSRIRRRSVTGLFTALFSRRRAEREQERGFDAADGAFLTPAPSADTAAQDPAIHDARRPRALLRWADKISEVSIEELSATGARLRSEATLPAAGAEVALTPRETALAALRVPGTISERSDADGTTTLSVTFERVMGLDASDDARFEDWLRAVNGPT